MTTLVTGANGFIGRHLIAALVARGERVTALVSRPTGLPVQDLVVARPWQAHRIASALANTAPVSLFHLAAAGTTDKALADASLVDANLAITRAVMQAAAQKQPRAIVCAGSCAEYAAADTPLREDMPLEMQQPYGASKAAAGQLALAQGAAAGLPVALVRLFNVYGPGEHPARLLPSLAHAVATGEALAMTSGEQRRDFLHVSDAVSALIAARDTLLVDNTSSCLTLNACTGIATPVADFALLYLAICNASPRLVRFGAKPQRPGDPPMVIGDPAAMLHKTGWRASVSVEQGLRMACGQTS